MNVYYLIITIISFDFCLFVFFSFLCCCWPMAIKNSTTTTTTTKSKTIADWRLQSTVHSWSSRWSAICIYCAVVGDGEEDDDVLQRRRLLPFIAAQRQQQRSSSLGWSR
jgi:hypothetical protein